MAKMTDAEFQESLKLLATILKNQPYYMAGFISAYLSDKELRQILKENSHLALKG